MHPWEFHRTLTDHSPIQVLNRDQNDIRIILADPSTGDYTEIYSESRKSWVEFYENIHVMNNGTGFIIKSYRTDWENLYYYDWEGNLKAQLTNVGWRVNGISEVDENSGLVYFTGTGPESTDNHFFRVGLDGKNLIQITKGPGTHSVLISAKGSYFIDTFLAIPADMPQEKYVFFSILTLTALGFTLFRFTPEGDWPYYVVITVAAMATGFLAHLVRVRAYRHAVVLRIVEQNQRHEIQRRTVQIQTC